MYYIGKLKGAYLLSIECGGTTYSKWVIITDPNRGMNVHVTNLVEHVMEIEGLPHRMWAWLHEMVDWNFVPRDELPGDVYDRLVWEESYLVEECDEY